jgi:hypothetical protein
MKKYLCEYYDPKLRDSGPGGLMREQPWRSIGWCFWMLGMACCRVLSFCKHRVGDSGRAVIDWDQEA